MIPIEAQNKNNVARNTANSPKVTPPNAIKGRSQGVAFLDRMRDYFTLLAKSVQFKSPNYAKRDLGLCFCGHKQ